jgi:hypothetical protein
MNLPSEIVRLVIREATCVPAAFDTSFAATVAEDTEAVNNAIRESMKIKLSLCLVSRSFHEIAIEFLYEIITVRQLRGDNPLIALLRNKYTPDSPPRGWWCRRLQISIGETSEAYCGWVEDHHVLWVLVHACPKLVIFLCTVRDNPGTVRRCNAFFGPTKFRIPRPLLQTVASNCSLTLKRIEIHGNLAIRMDRAELLLKACTFLEVFRIERVELFDPEWHVYDSPYESDPDEDDLESERTSDPQLNDEVMKESWHKRERVTWPTDTGRQDMVLSNLHTLEMYPFYLYPGILTLPALRCVGARLDMSTNPEVSKAILDQALGDTYHRLTHVTYWGPTTIIWDILDRFPNVTDFTFGAILNNSSAVVSTHRHLRASKINLIWSTYSPETTTDFLTTIAQAVADGIFPSLRAVRVYEYRSQINQAQIDQFSQLGLALEFTMRYNSRFWKYVAFFQRMCYCVNFELQYVHLILKLILRNGEMYSILMGRSESKCFVFNNDGQFILHLGVGKVLIPCNSVCRATSPPLPGVSILS